MNNDNSMEQVTKKELETMAEGTHSGLYFEPLVDIYETDEGLTILADMPGVTEKDVDMDLRDGVLTILGKQGHSEGGGEVEHREFEFGNYLRRFTVTDAVDQEKISASITGGVLTVVLPKAERAKPRSIPVTAG